MTGSGTLLDPYIIYDVNDLQAMENDLTAYYELANDIDASATVGWNAGRGFIPVGSADPYFTGQLDGKGHKVTDLFMDWSVLALGRVGLFSQIVTPAEVKNLGIETADLTAANYIGAIAGYSDRGKISNCWSSGTINGIGALGGIVGYLGNPLGGPAIEAISRCFSTIDITGTTMRLGGLVGYIWFTTISDSYARGSVNGGAAASVGGLVGRNSGGIVSRCHSTGAVVSAGAGVGGLIGDVTHGGTAPDSFWDTQTSGQPASAGGTGKTTAQMKTKSTFTDAGWDFNTIWDILSHCNDGYPCLRDVTPCCQPLAPSVTTDPATLIGATSSTPNGTLDDDGGEACDCGFEWGETGAYGNTTPTQNRTIGQTFSQVIIGLDPNTTYHFRAFATNAAGTSYGADRSFTTNPLPPSVTTDPATLIGTTSSTPNGTLDDDGGEACDCGFEWGETIAYEHGATPTDSKTTGETFSQVIIGLAPNTTYHFRALATNAAGTDYGADRTFTTDPLPPAVVIPTVITNLASAIGLILATLHLFLDDDGGEACDCGFEWGETIAYEHGATPTDSKTTGETFSHIIGGLFPGFTYHFRAFATNSAGTGYGADRSFTSTSSFSRAHALSREEL